MFLIAETQWYPNSGRASDEALSSYPTYVGNITAYYSTHFTCSFPTYKPESFTNTRYVDYGIGITH
jgi:hypothetical protein